MTSAAALPEPGEAVPLPGEGPTLVQQVPVARQPAAGLVGARSESPASANRGCGTRAPSRRVDTGGQTVWASILRPRAPRRARAQVSVGRA